MELDAKNAKNVAAEAHNKVSIALTVAYRDARASSNGVGALDVGEILQAFVAYTSEEKLMMLHSPEFLAAVGPLPYSLTKLIAQHRAEQAVKREREREEKEKAKTASLLGSMVYTRAHEVTPLLKQEVVIPTIFLVSLRHKVYFPLHWWSNAVLRKAAESPHMISKEFSRAEQSASYSIGERVQVVDVTKCAKLFDGEDEAKYLTPSLWRQAANNLLSAFQQLCPAVDPLKPDTRNYSSELAAHFAWFSNLECFDSKMDVWLPVERKMRYALLGEGLFREETWADEIRSVLILHTHAQALASMYGASPAAAPAAYGGGKRPWADHGDALAKRPRHESYGRSDGHGRGEEGRGNFAPRGPATCLVCTGPHVAAHHPPNLSSFRDGRPFFCKPDGRNLVTAAAFQGPTPKGVCILYNTGRCGGVHPGERLHICSLCGGTHGALSLHGTCKRVKDGAFVP
ncbi:hypothetical protein B0H15DRAFT_982193 [Mycena belliarum]|uniref:Uncharacterized protein n=1 Tax=Mycena belliarum TaxID=1033014 RepID=A0AAD6XQW9_9AGAR|nr:hypothetical protein B0H15DRAFT_982193 [Mycena belliae]